MKRGKLASSEKVGTPLRSASSSRTTSPALNSEDSRTLDEQREAAREVVATEARLGLDVTNLADRLLPGGGDSSDE